MSGQPERTVFDVFAKVFSDNIIINTIRKYEIQLHATIF